MWLGFAFPVRWFYATGMSLHPTPPTHPNPTCYVASNMCATSTMSLHPTPPTHPNPTCYVASNMCATSAMSLHPTRPTHPTQPTWQAWRKMHLSRHIQWAKHVPKRVVTYDWSPKQMRNSFWVPSWLNSELDSTAALCLSWLVSSALWIAWHFFVAQERLILGCFKSGVWRLPDWPDQVGLCLGLQRYVVQKPVNWSETVGNAFWNLFAP